jgi:hypothetical protein
MSMTLDQQSPLVLSREERIHAPRAFWSSSHFLRAPSWSFVALPTVCEASSSQTRLRLGRADLGS